MKDGVADLITESRSSYNNLDVMSVRQILETINQEDAKVPKAVAAVIPAIEKAVQLVVASFRKGGRLFYVGAGSSGRIGVLDASECPPTFGVDPDMVQGIIAGGDRALRDSIEGAEDDAAAGAADLQAHGISNKDVVVGIAASGRTPYVIGATEEALKVGATTIALVCNPDSPLGRLADVVIAPIVGPEVLTGSTRMKAGTAQKLVLNMITTTSMIQMGKVYSNLMVDVVASNEKLNHRARRIIKLATGCDDKEAEEAFRLSNGEVKTAIVVVLSGCDAQRARRLLAQADGYVRKALELANSS